MAGKGGKIPGAGRKKGSKTKTKLAKIEAARAEITGDLMPLDVLLKAMRQYDAEGNIQQATAVAEVAAPYCHAKQASVTTTSTTTAELTLTIKRDSNFYRNADRLLANGTGASDADSAPPRTHEGGGVRPALGQNGAGANGSP